MQIYFFDELYLWKSSESALAIEIAMTRKISSAEQNIFSDATKRAANKETAIRTKSIYLSLVSS
jgi:hypothetical protein